MATTSNIRTDGGGDYTSIQAWENAQPATITETDIGELTVDEAHDEQVTIDGHTTAADKYLWLRAVDGNEYDHVNKTGARIVDTNTGTTNLSYAIQLKDNYHRLGGHDNGTSTGSIGITRTWDRSASMYGVEIRNSSDCLVEQIVVYGIDNSGNTYAFYSSSTPTIDNIFINCLAYDLAASGAFADCAGFYTEGLGQEFECRNCTVDNITGSDDG